MDYKKEMALIVAIMGDRGRIILTRIANCKCI